MYVSALQRAVSDHVRHFFRQRHIAATHIQYPWMRNLGCHLNMFYQIRKFPSQYIDSMIVREFFMGVDEGMIKLGFVFLCDR